MRKAPPHSSVFSNFHITSSFEKWSPLNKSFELNLILSAWKYSNLRFDREFPTENPSTQLQIMN